MEEKAETSEQRKENQSLISMIGESTTRRKAMNEFEKLGEDALVTLVNEGMSDKDSGVQRASMDLIGRIRTSKGLPYLILGTQSEDSKIRWHATNGLRRFNSKKSVKTLIRTLSDEDKYVRRRAAKSLGEIGDVTLVEIERLLESEDELQMMGAVRVLYWVSGNKSENLLIKAAQNANTKIRTMAEEILETRNLEIPERPEVVSKEPTEEREKETVEIKEELVEDVKKETGLEEKTVVELKDMLRDKKMKVSGKKAELIERLENY